MNYETILNFWFKEIQSVNWYKKDTNFDLLLKERFEGILIKASAGELSSWRTSARGRLAEVIVLDQFSRNIYRDTVKSFSQDSMSLTLSQETVRLGLDRNLSDLERSFLYMPFMHSESKSIHEDAVKLFSRLENKNNLDFEMQHKKIIDRFGRYPHRNEILERVSTNEEKDFLKEKNSSF